ncbi:uncharacterized protein LOC144133634 [Amblyomma americanum]
MPTTQATQTRVQRPDQETALLHQREPRTFHGETEEDVVEWLRHYERCSKYNRWNSTARLYNVVFFFAGKALTWFDNHEEILTTWSRFVEEISKSFGDTLAKKERAEQQLSQRAQLPGETCTRYIEEVLKLCRTVNRQMLEDDKVGHLLKRIAEDVYHFLISRDTLDTVADVIKQCRAFEALKARRIAPKFGRLSNVTTVASVDVPYPEDIASIVRRIVREELAAQRPRTNFYVHYQGHRGPCHHGNSLRHVLLPQMATDHVTPPAPSGPGNRRRTLISSSVRPILVKCLVVRPVACLSPLLNLQRILI